MDGLRKAIAIDFDGCLCVDAFPAIGEPNWPVIKRAQAEQQAGAGLILWTCREGQILQDAIVACESWGLIFDAVNESLPDWIEAFGTTPRKVGASEYWDDKAVQMPGFRAFMIGGQALAHAGCICGLGKRKVIEMNRPNTSVSKAVSAQSHKESFYQAKIVRWLKETYPGAFIWKAAAGPYSRGGIPDICAIIDGHFFGFEVKRPKVGRLSKIQERTIMEINAAGGTAAVVSFPEQVEKIILAAGIN